jgi:hypothetical protein
MESRTGQTFIGLKVSDELFKSVEKASKGRDKSQFVREAIAEKLQREGLTLKEEHILPPSRKGKGGPKKYAKTKTQSQTQRKKI